MSKSKEAIRRWTAEDMEILPFDVADYLDNEEIAVEYLNAVAQHEDPQLLSDAIGDVARAYGMCKVAKSAHVNRVSLYKSLSKTGNPSFETVINVLAALGLTFRIQPIEAGERSK